MTTLRDLIYDLGALCYKRGYEAANEGDPVDLEFVQENVDETIDDILNRLIG